MLPMLFCASVDSCKNEKQKQKTTLPLKWVSRCTGRELPKTTSCPFGEWTCLCFPAIVANSPIYRPWKVTGQLQTRFCLRKHRRKPCRKKANSLLISLPHLVTPISVSEGIAVMRMENTFLIKERDKPPRSILPPSELVLCPPTLYPP